MVRVVETLCLCANTNVCFHEHRGGGGWGAFTPGSISTVFCCVCDSTALSVPICCVNCDVKQPNPDDPCPLSAGAPTGLPRCTALLSYTMQCVHDRLRASDLSHNSELRRLPPLLRLCIIITTRPFLHISANVSTCRMSSTVNVSGKGSYRDLDLTKHQTQGKTKIDFEHGGGCAEAAARMGGDTWLKGTGNNRERESCLNY